MVEIIKLKLERTIVKWEAWEMKLDVTSRHKNEDLNSEDVIVVLFVCLLVCLFVCIIKPT